MTDEINTLRADITAARAAYYGNEPTVSDEAFDAKIDRLRALSPGDPVLAQVGAPAADTGRKRALEAPMRSMEKVKSLAEIAKWAKRYHLPGTTQLVAMPKYDGISCQENQRTKTASTRGDGTVGTSCDEHIRLVQGFVAAPLPYLTFGEVIMPNVNFAKYAEEGDANPRNTTGGLLSDPEVPEGLRDCHVVRYGLLPLEAEAVSLINKTEVLGALNRWQQFPVPYRVFTIDELDADTLKALYLEWSQVYTLDGLILEVNDLHLQKQLGYERSGDPAFARAYKADFEEVKETTVTGVTWKTSKFGKLVPTVQLVPVNCDGATVSNPTGNNARYLMQMGIVPGATVRVKRSGGVIPQIIDVVTPGTNPLALPVACACGQQVSWDENQVHLLCENPQCPAQELMRMVAFCTILKMDGVREGVLTQLYEAGYTTIRELLDVTPAGLELLEGFGPRKAVQTVRAIYTKLDNIPLPQLQHASGLFRPLGSKKLALLQHFTEVPTLEEVCAVPGFSEKSARAYLRGRALFPAFVAGLPLTYKTTVKEVVTEGHLLGKSFVFTGVRRKDLEGLIEAAGGRVSDNVNKDTAYLVVKDLGTSSAKMVKAQKLDVPVLDEAGAEKLIAGEI